MASGFTVHPIGDITRVTLDGPRLVGSRLIARVEEGVRALLEDPAHPRRRLILDFHQVEELSSNALAALVSMQQVAVAVGGRIKLVELLPQAMEMVRFTRLDTVFEMHESEHQALTDYRSRTPVTDDTAAPANGSAAGASADGQPAATNPAPTSESSPTAADKA